MLSAAQPSTYCTSKVPQRHFGTQPLFARWQSAMCMERGGLARGRRAGVCTGRWAVATTGVSEPGGWELQLLGAGTQQHCGVAQSMRPPCPRCARSTLVSPRQMPRTPMATTPNPRRAPEDLPKGLKIANKNLLFRAGGPAHCLRSRCSVLGHCLVQRWWVHRWWVGHDQHCYRLFGPVRLDLGSL